MKYIFLLLSGCLIAVTTVATDSPVSQVFQMRLVLDQPSADADQMTVVGNDPGQKETLSVSKAVLLDQTDLKSAEVITNMPDDATNTDGLLKGWKIRVPACQIDIDFTADGAKLFADVTSKNIGKRLAIVIDGRLYEAPKILQPISSGNVAISGGFSVQEAREIVAKITQSLQK